MKVLILNSGVGSRMKDLATCKCLVELADGVTVLDAQLQALLRCGIEDFCITTGPYADELEIYIRKRYPNVNFIFVNNPLYSQTNYIYSIQLARNFVCDDDILLLHGDLVFEQNVLQDIIASEHSVMVVDSTKPLPKKDFKAVVKNGRIKGIGIDLFSEALYAQPLYKLMKQDWILWLDEIDRFCSRGITGVYAENAFNNISDKMNIFPLDITGRMCFEVDNREDLAYAQNAYKVMTDRLQKVYFGYNSRRHIQNIIRDAKAKKPFVVCGTNRKGSSITFEQDVVYFSGFTSNPDITEIMSGIELFEANACDFIVSIGGGSAIDTAKCINMLSNNNNHAELRDAPRACHLAVPTTAGTGSESTCFAVIYRNGEKLSIEHRNIMPEYVVLDPEFLTTLPDYHKKSTLLDALCQAIESIWANGSTDESKAYAMSAVRLILENADVYFSAADSDKENARLMILQAANLSGKAINISKTTAAHAMSYRLSSMFGLAHGHAVALCLLPVWQNMLEKNFGHMEGSLIDLKTAFSVKTHKEAYEIISQLFIKWDISYHFNCGDDINSVIDDLVASVNVQRLSNHPVVLSDDVLADIYRKIISK